MTATMCCRSLCQVHNETMNIYTHFVPALYILVQLCMLWTASGPYSEFKMAQSFYVQLACCLSILFCMLASSVYHTFGPMSSYHYYLLLKVDLIGIGVMIFGLTLSAVYIGFHNW